MIWAKPIDDLGKHMVWLDQRLVTEGLSMHGKDWRVRCCPTYR